MKRREAEGPLGSNESTMKYEKDNCNAFNHVVVAQLVKVPPREITRTLVTSDPSHRQKDSGPPRAAKNKHNKRVASRETGGLFTECGVTSSP